MLVYTLLNKHSYFFIYLSTHPDITSLVEPLFSFAGKRVKEFFIFPFLLSLFVFSYPLSAVGEERVVQRSVDRVSRLHAIGHYLL